MGGRGQVSWLSDGANPGPTPKPALFPHSQRWGPEGELGRLRVPGVGPVGRNQAPRSSGKESWRRMTTGARYWTGMRGPGERGWWLAVVGGAGEGRGSHRALAGRQAEVRAEFGQYRAAP